MQAPAATGQPWNEPVLLAYLVSDAVIGVACIVIALALASLLHRARRDIPPGLLAVAVAIAAVVVLGGLTHLVEAWTLGQPARWIVAGVKMVTAAASLATAAVVPFIVPRVHAKLRRAKLARGRERDLVVELRRVAAEARRHLDELEATYRSAPVGLCVLDTDLRFVRINERLASMNGHSADAHLGRTIRELLPAIAAQAEPILRAVIESGQPVVGVEIQGETPAEPGVDRLWIESWHPLRGRDGTVVGVNVVAEDVTDRRRESTELARTVEELRQANARLERLTEDLRFANEELATASAQAGAARVMAEQASAAKSAFLATMSHELRTPLNAVLGYVELLSLEIVGPVTEGQRGYLDRVTTSARHLLGLINEVLDLTKVEAGQMTVDLRPTPVVGEMHDALTLVRPQAEAKHLMLDIEAPSARGLLAAADPGRLRQILVNLLGNAVRFTAPDGRVAIRAARVDRTGGGIPPTLRGEGPWVRVDVADTGIGIPPHRLEAIFDPFVQVAREGEGVYTRQHGGTGLGLTIARRLARLMGGDLTAESTEGIGSTFTVWLPAVLPPPAHRAGPGRDHAARLEVGRVLTEHAAPIVATVADRMRDDTSIPAAHDAAQIDLEDHMVAFLADLGQALTILDATDGDRMQLLADGSALQRLLVERHGKQRLRLGWGEPELRREFELLLQEVERAVRREGQATAEAPLADLLTLVRTFVETATKIAIAAHRSAAPMRAADDPTFRIE